MPWAFDISGLKRNFILFLLRRAEMRLKRLKQIRAADLAALDSLRETPSQRALSVAKIEAYFDHHADQVIDWMRILDGLLAQNAASRMRRMTR